MNKIVSIYIYAVWALPYSYFVPPDYEDADYEVASLRKAESILWGLLNVDEGEPADNIDLTITYEDGTQKRIKRAQNLVPRRYERGFLADELQAIGA